VTESRQAGVKYVWVLSVETYLNWWRGAAGERAETPAGSAAGTGAAGDAAAGDAAGGDATGGEAAGRGAAGDVPRLVFARMQPARLARPIVIRADIGEAAVRLVCSRCSPVMIDDPPHFSPPVPCLHVFGAELLQTGQPPKQLSGKEYIVPVHFVTDILAGPSVFLTGEEAAQRAAILPTGFIPSNKMSVRAVESVLAEFAVK
jgi:hypothetical protein